MRHLLTYLHEVIKLTPICRNITSKYFLWSCLLLCLQYMLYQNSWPLNVKTNITNLYETSTTKYIVDLSIISWTIYLTILSTKHNQTHWRFINDFINHLFLETDDDTFHKLSSHSLKIDLKIDVKPNVFLIQNKYW